MVFQLIHVFIILYSETAGGGGVLKVYMTGGPTYFFGLKIYTLCIFLV